MHIATEILEIPKRVRNGIAVLDKDKPDWFLRINLSALDLQDCENCVLGQTYGHYSFGTRQLFGTTHNERDKIKLQNHYRNVNDHGFDLDILNLIDHPWHHLSNDDDDCPYYQALTKEWKNIIQQRQVAAKAETN